jgi:sigma-54 dependent transcriptional regulator, flagellar regulatory protein
MMLKTALPNESAVAPDAFVPDPGLIYGAGSPIAAIRATCIRIAASNATALLTGETGTGKEVFARLVHTRSGRAKHPFVPVNCGAIPESLIESELFGYVRGAFTGAGASRRGRVGMAEGGTLFLDEIGELSLAMQVKLLRLLQERTYEPVGSPTSVTANFRLVVATNRDLADLVRQGRFRSDLYYRLHVCPVHLPPLRERRCDVVPLFQHFWKRHGEERPVTSAVMRQLESYDWPGNVRELENLVERLSVCAQGRIIEMADLPTSFLEPQDGTLLDGAEVGVAQVDEISQEYWPDREVSSRTISLPERSGLLDDSTRRGPVAVPAEIANRPMARAESTPTPAPLPTPTLPGNLTLPVDLPNLLRALEDSYIKLALEQSAGNKKEAARLLGLGRTTLVEKLRRRGGDVSAP